MILHTTLGTHPRERKTYVHTYLYAKVHSSFICNKLETTQFPSAGEEMNASCYTYITEYHPAIKKIINYLYTQQHG